MVKENWQDHGTPFEKFDEEITEQWKKAGGLGFSLNVARDWLNIGLTYKDAEFAYFLELKGWTPEHVLNHGDLKKLKKAFRKFLKTQPPKKQPHIKPDEVRDPFKCKICDTNTFYTFKSWQKAHGERKRPKDPWIVVLTRPFKDAYQVHTEICGECRHPQHIKSCSWWVKT